MVHSNWYVSSSDIISTKYSHTQLKLPRGKWRKKKISFTEQFKDNYGNKMTGALSHKHDQQGGRLVLDGV